ncbi:DNA replication/repair protein RecF [Gryllotalpicola sp.]|uniref:DNA replication/repair protein RecF n=1 Tax=Gryllotalpicola sp. TaxID=1932787 RepID=UPI002631D836|nr:DNA replication/repair protein RecF [Gryllotalpicola sp.]
MHVKHLSLTDFRNYRSADVELTRGVTVFVGPNGQGKTNLVESLSYLSTLASHRTSDDRALLRVGCDMAIVRALLRHGDRELLVEVQLNRAAANKAQVNRVAIRTRDLPRYFSSVLFAPEDLALVRGEPGVRRRFLDELLVQRTPRLVGVLADYERVVKQRNSLLKSARARGLRVDQLTTLDIWDERLVELGSEIIDERQALLDALAEPVRRGYQAVAGADHHPTLSLRLSTRGADPEEEDGAAVKIGEAAASTVDQFRAALTGARRRELDRGVSLLGPHRDDVLFELNDLPAKGYASHGESWSFALALRLGAAELLRAESTTGDPVLLLDDVFAELDSGRRALLAQAVADYEQVIITAAVLDDIPPGLGAGLIHIQAGEVVP